MKHDGYWWFNHQGNLLYQHCLKAKFTYRLMSLTFPPQEWYRFQQNNRWILHQHFEDTIVDQKEAISSLPLLQDLKNIAMYNRMKHNYHGLSISNLHNVGLLQSYQTTKRGSWPQTPKTSGIRSIHVTPFYLYFLFRERYQKLIRS